MTAPLDERFVRAALREAAKGVGFTSPNPAVGAVLVSAGKIVARGHHRAAGQPHAEIECLQAFGRRIPRSATLYVTLEPCSTVGRTPPCTEALIRAGVRNIVIGAIDPNPKHSGRGVELLRAAGINVRAGVLRRECAKLNEAHHKWVRTGLPLVIAKCGMTLDGRLTRLPQEGKWITSAASRAHANQFRATVDAILVGANTLRADDPRLTVRARRNARQPWRVVVTRSGQLPDKAKLFTDRFADRTLVFRNQPLGEVLRALGQRGISSVLIEGGGEVLGEALDARLVDHVRIYVAPLLTGGPVLAFAGAGADSTSGGIALREISYERVGDDIFFTARTATPDSMPE